MKKKIVSFAFVLVLLLSMMLIALTTTSVDANSSEIEIYYDNNASNPGGLGGSLPGGLAVDFTPPSEEYWVLKRVKFYGMRWANESYDSMLFYIEVWDKNKNELLHVAYKYSDYFKNYDSKWVTVDIPDVLVKDDFFVCIFPNMVYTPSEPSPHMNVGFNNDPPISNRSYRVRMDDNSIEWQIPGNLFIRAIVGEPIIVPDDYPTIQIAINNANEGDTVFVKTGTYHENVVVNKTVSLIGENRSTTIIDGNGTGTVVFVTESNVLVRGFTTRNGGGEWPDSVFLNESRSSIIIDNVLTTTEYGIRLRLSNNTVVSDNIILNNGWVGIFSWFSSNNTIRENMVTNNTWCGICLDSSSNSTVSDNTITDTEIGIYSHYSLNNSMSGNNVTSNRYGIFLDYSSNNVLRDNIMAGNKYNFGVCRNYWLGELSHFINDVDASNTVDGRPILYLVNEQNRIIDPPTASNIGYLAVINSTNIVVRHLNMKNNWEGIFLAYTKDSLIQNVTVTSNYYGINLVSSSNISITENNITNNGNGVYLARSSNNTIVENSIANNEDGVWLYDHSCNNSISGNNVTANKRYGIYLWFSSVGNSIVHNNFVENQQHALIKGYHGNLWDSDYLSGGNYWSDYTGADLYSGPYQDETGSDGIGDTPYAIDTRSMDRFPLMAPINIFDVGTWNGEVCEIHVVSNSTVSSFQLNATEKIIGFNVTGEAGSGFCRVTIPNIIIQNMWQGNYTVLVDRETPLDVRNWTDADNTYIYFTYLHSEHEVIIIPELSSALILPLLMIFTLVAAALSNKKRH